MAGSILIVDDVATNRIVLKAKLTGAHYATLQAANGAEAIAIAASERPGLILADVDLPDMTGTEMIACLRADAETRHIPLIALTRRDDPVLRLELLEAGADEVLSKPIDELVLMARLRSLLRAHASAEDFALRALTFRELGFAETADDYVAPVRIGLIARTRETALRWKMALARTLPGDRIEVLSEDAPIRRADDAAPEAFVIEADPARPHDGLRLMSELRSHAATRDAVIAIAVPRFAHETQATALDLGADDLLPADLSAPLAAEEAAQRLRAQLARKRLHDRLRISVNEGLRLATVDPLTGLHNRRFATTQLARLSERARRTGRPFMVMLLDLDRFKRINDTFGHSAGDHVLTAFGKALKTHLRGVELIARIGGEEFLVAMPEISPDRGQHLARHLRDAIAAQPIRLPDGGAIRITVSIGLAFGGLRDDDPQHLVEEADAALLNAKATGRNQVALSRKIAAA
ncbi:diguanylate cyclase [Thioclava atlantica]|uniref:diguanylate cyclase n=1 Tax=Thioclava atlantica TaxID=1317124 RepID=A0A085U112_9RHOB|nr:diguanylate cyclase [Thioclava atlantica]KFE36659.1 response regulator receiver modulated diguanylate cyclase/phosphodiesterase [Thioclava atlantica]